MYDKPVLVFVPGMFCHAGVFNPLIKYFESKGWQCKALTLPFHEIPKPHKPDPKLASMGIREYTDFLLGKLLELDRDFVLIGHSMGGLISLKATGLMRNMHPQVLVLLAPAAPWGVVALEPSVLKSFQPILRTWKFWQKTIELGFEEIEFSMLNMVPEDQRRAIFDSLRYESGRVAFEMGFWFLGNFATRVQIKRIKCPVVIFVGEEDNITPQVVVAKTFKKIRRKLSDQVVFIPLPGLGHWLITEMDPQMLEQLILKRLAE